MKNFLKNNRGSLTIISLFTVLIFSLYGILLYARSASSYIRQTKSIETIQAIYAQDAPNAARIAEQLETSYTEVYKEKNYTLTFDSKGGSSIASMNIPSGDFANKPDDPTRDMYEFLGWYKESELINTFDFSTERIESDLTLYAKWSRTKYVYNGELTFNGTSDYLNTEVYLFSQENANRNFEISFNIDEYSSDNSNLKTIFCSINESSSPYAGIVYRYNYDASKVQLECNYKTVAEKQNNYNIGNVKRMSIIRINNIVYCSINDGIYNKMIDFSGFNKYFNVPVTFGSTANASGGHYRFFKGKISNILVKIDDNIIKSDYNIN